jgi:hypothetical protein
MKILRFLLVGAVALTLIIALHERSSAQSTNLTQDQEPIDKLTSLVVSLTKRGDTNTVAKISDLFSAMERQRGATDASFDVRLLTALRSGKTNDAIELLETRLDGAVMTFSYDRDTKYDKLLERAKEYRSKYPHKSGTPEIDAAVARAFDSLPMKSK